MEAVLGWFREYPAESITAQDIEGQFEKQEWAPATHNRYRALLSLTYRLAILAAQLREEVAELRKTLYEVIHNEVDIQVVNTLKAYHLLDANNAPTHWSK
jgi:hypothetical protein